MPKLNIKKAKVDILSMSDSELEEETAYTWASRAIAAYWLAGEADNDEDFRKWKERAEDLRHEALEHAALVGDFGRTTGILQREIDSHKLDY